MRDWQKWVRDYLDLPAMTGGRDERIVAELAAHLEETWREAKAHGATDEEAEALVRARLGDRERAARELGRSEPRRRSAAVARWAEEREQRLRRRGRRWVPVADLARDVRVAFRTLLRRPLATAVTVVVLALGIGATASIFSIVHAVVLEPLPYPEANRLVGLWLTDRDDPRGRFPEIAYVHCRRENRSLDELGLYRRVGANVGGAGHPEQVDAALVSPSVFAVLGVPPGLGRPFVEQEGRPGAEPSVIISQALWSGRFGADPAVVGRTMEVDGEARMIVGVMPAAFEFPDASTRLWLPMTIDPAKPDRSYWRNLAIGRLKPGVGRADAEAQLNGLVASLPREYPDPERAREVFEQLRLGVAVTSYKEDVTGDVASTLWLLLASGAVLLLVACANVGGLFLVNAERRRQEIAVRVALGAGRGALLRTFLAESALVGLAGGAAGLLLAGAATPAILALAPEGIPRLGHAGIDATVVAAALAVALAASFAFGIAPALGRIAGPADVLRGARGSTAGRARVRIRSALAVAQMALALVLMVASGLMVRSYVNLRSVEHGFDPSGVLTLRVPLSAADYPTPRAVATFYGEVLARLRAVPGVASAGAGSGLPYERQGTLLGTSLEGFLTAPGEHVPNYATQLVFPGFFKSLGIPLLAGRLFDDADLTGPARAVIVSRALADRFWAGQDPIGKRLTPGSPDSGNGWYQIVGVVGSVRYEGPARPPTEVIYYPFRPLRFSAGAAPILPLDLTIVVRSSVPPAALAPAARRAVWAVDPRLPVVALRTMDDVTRRAVARPTFTMLLIVLAASMALALGIVGLYGVMSSLAAQRTREIGIRLALGATKESVTSIVLRSGIALAGAGVAVGLAASLALAGLLRSFLFEVSPFDPITFVAVAAALVLVALVASYVPAHRAARVDPVVVLRAE